MSMSTSGAAGIVTPEEIGALIVQPVERESVAMQVATVVHTSATAHDFRIPVVTDDPTAGWFAEGTEITASDATIDEVVVSPFKVAGLTIISRELADDSDPDAAQVVGNGLARDIAAKVDLAFFADTTANAPDGLLSLPGVQQVDIGVAITNTDVFAEALSKAESVGATITAFVANPTDVLALAMVKKATGSNEPLLGNDPTAPTKRTILGVPLLSTPAITAGTLWAIPQAKVFVVVRDDTKLDVDYSAYFSTDRVGIRATMRVGFGFPHEAAVVQLTNVA